LRKILPVLAVIVFGLVFGRAAHAQVQVFGGYSYLHLGSVSAQTTLDCPGVGCPITTTTTIHLNLNGWEASASFNPVPVFGFTADFAGNYGTLDASTVHMQTYLFGPQVHFPGPISPFAHVLFGDAHEAIGNGSSGATEVTGSSANAFAIAAGGGLDIKLVPFVSLRVIQIDDLITRFGSATQHQPRASAGLVIHF
jgi:hypothetical protein